MKLNLQKKKFITEKNLSDIIKIGINFGEKLNAISQKCINPYDDSGDTSYVAGEYVIYDGYIWQVKVATSGAWVESRFTKLCDELSLIDLQTIKNMINLSDEEIANLQSLILDSSIELSHVWSSSKTYTEIQNAIKKGEAFTLSKLASTMTASFEVATSISDIKEGNILYLLNTGTNTYDIYALISGTPTKIASTTIDLSQYAKLTDLNNYVKKTDADGKYATITTVDGKVDKTSILSSISSTPSDDNLLSEKAIKSELDTINTNLDDKVNKASITTTIDSSSTDSEVPSAKSVWDNIQNKNTMQPWGTMAKYSTVFDWAVNNVGATCPYEGNNLADCPLKNTWGTLVCIGIKTENGLKVLACSNFNENIYIRTILRRNGTNEWVEPNWKRVCSTSVADVPITYINKFENETYVKPSDTNVCSYYVTNGHCIIRLETVCLSTTQNFVQLVSGLPKPKDGLFSNVIDRQMESNSGARGIFHLLPSGILRVVCNYGDSSVTEPRKFYATFSYPVAES